MRLTNSQKAKTFFIDSLWSILALGIMNVVSQFIVYPILRRVLGSESYGNILYLLGVINIMATSIGSAANLARMVSSVKGKTYNIDSALGLFAAQILCLPVCRFVMVRSGMPTPVHQVVLFWILACATIWRYYADVEYRLNINYKGYFLYYLIISLGYLLGILLFHFSKCWQMIFLPGELAGLIFVRYKGNILRADKAFEKERFFTYLHVAINLMIAQLFVNVVLNADRLVLKAFIGGEAVTLYYIASLMGKTMALISAPLNSVIIGHLVKSKELLTGKMFLTLSIAGIGLTLVTLVCCVLCSHVFVSIFYPQEYETVKSLLVLANLSQIIYFAVGILTTVLLRYIHEHFQVIINVSYVIVFAVVTITATNLWGIYGFAIGLLITNTFRYLFVTILGVVELNRLYVMRNMKSQEE